MAQRLELQGEMKDWRATAEANVGAVRELEGKVQQLAAEKRDFELLLVRCSSTHK